MNGIRNVSLAREQSRPEVYFICGGAKLWIPTEQEFLALGFSWEKVRAVPDGTLDSFTPAPFVAEPAARPSDVFFDVEYTLQLGPGIVIRSTDCHNFGNLDRFLQFVRTRPT